MIQYYTFSLNGQNETSWKQVRLHLATSPWEKSCYFAKIQFGPAYPVTDTQACDRAAADFVKNFLPDVLQALPVNATIQKLNSGRTW
jgi:hypothetical protein